MRSHPNSDRNLSHTNTYAPAVPLTVYRELAAELQTAKSISDSLNAQNQQLTQQNQQLRQEIAKAVESILRLEQIVKSQKAHNLSASVPKQTTPKSIHKIPKVTQGLQPFPTYQTSLAEETVIEQEQHRYRRHHDVKASGAVNGWFLVLAIILIMVTAFGAGYFLMRPLVRSR